MGRCGVAPLVRSESGGKPFSGHHVGLYGQIVTYDFNGWERLLGDKWSYGEAWLTATRYLWDIGSMWISRWESATLEDRTRSTSLDGHYVWQTTKTAAGSGPTKAGISLVWLIGRGEL